jgi:hypothetical protein
VTTIRTEHLPLLKRILRRLQLDDVSGCWTWTGQTSRGYGRIDVAGRRLLVHRVLFGLLVREPAAALKLDHVCRNRRCANPAHLEEVTNRTNVIRGVLSRRAAGTLPLPFAEN